MSVAWGSQFSNVMIYFSNDNKLAKSFFFNGVYHNYLELKLGRWLNFSLDCQVLKNATVT